MFDQLSLQADPAWQRSAEFEEGEVVLFSAYVTKINRRDTKQKRVLVVSTCAVYNCSPRSRKVKRKILLHKIEGLGFSASSTELVIHIPSEYDYRFEFHEGREQFMSTLSHALLERLGIRLPNALHPQASLKDVVFTKSESLRRNSGRFNVAGPSAAGGSGAGNRSSVKLAARAMALSVNVGELLPIFEHDEDSDDDSEDDEPTMRHGAFLPLHNAACTADHPHRMLFAVASSRSLGKKS